MTYSFGELAPPLGIGIAPMAEPAVTVALPCTLLSRPIPVHRRYGVAHIHTSLMSQLPYSLTVEPLTGRYAQMPE